MYRLSGDYNRGYTQAIQDIQEIFDYINLDLKHHHKNMTAKVAKQLLAAILRERENIREEHFTLSATPQGFIRWNNQKNDFEYFKRRDIDC